MGKEKEQREDKAFAFLELFLFVIFTDLFSVSLILQSKYVMRRFRDEYIQSQMRFQRTMER